MYRVLVGMAEDERFIRGSGKDRREILISEKCVNDLDSVSSYLEVCDETLICIKAGMFVFS